MHYRLAVAFIALSWQAVPLTFAARDHTVKGSRVVLSVSGGRAGLHLQHQRPIFHGAGSSFLQESETEEDIGRPHSEQYASTGEKAERSLSNVGEKMSDGTVEPHKASDSGHTKPGTRDDANSMFDEASDATAVVEQPPYREAMSEAERTQQSLTQSSAAAFIGSASISEGSGEVERSTGAGMNKSALDAVEANANKAALTSAPQKQAGQQQRLLPVGVALMLFGVAAIFGYALLRRKRRQENVAEPRSVRDHVVDLPRQPWEEAEGLLLQKASYYSRPLASPTSLHMLVRIEARIVGPASDAKTPLIAPLGKHECVLYSSMVSRQIHYGSPPVPLAFAFATMDFHIAPVGCPDKRVFVSGDDVSLFDIQGGHHAAQHAFANAPPHWQSFVQEHRAMSTATNWQSSSLLRGDEALLNFDECALLVDATATLVGELHLDMDGAISLRPPRKSGTSPIASDVTKFNKHHSQMAALTSWETEGAAATPEFEGDPGKVAGVDADMLVGKILVSDDDSLRTPETARRKWFQQCAVCWPGRRPPVSAAESHADTVKDKQDTSQ